MKILKESDKAIVKTIEQKIRKKINGHGSGLQRSRRKDFKS